MRRDEGCELVVDRSTTRSKLGRIGWTFRGRKTISEAPLLSRETFQRCQDRICQPVSVRQRNPADSFMPTPALRAVTTQAAVSGST